MKCLLAFLFVLPAFACYSQQNKVINVGKEELRISPNQFYTVNGEPVSSTKYVRVVEGSPYFNEAWMKGSLDLSDGRGYENLWLKLDLADNSVLYLDAEGKEMIATSVIKNVTLIDSVSGRKYDFVHSSFIKGSGKIQTGWYQSIASGKATLYKRSAKVVNETKPYGLATYEQSIVTTDSYFLLADSVISPVKKINALPNMLSDKKEELSQYITSKSLSGRSDADYARLISFYNSFFAP